MLRFLIMLFALIVGVLPGAHAQDEAESSTDNQILDVAPEGDRALLDLNEYNFVSGPYYNQMAQTLFRDRPAIFDYGGLRLQYSMTRHYDPVADDTRRQMLNLAYKIENEKDEAKIKEALDDYTQLVIAHLGNMKIVLQAQALARQDKRFGDPAFFQQVHAGLLRNVMLSGDGSTLLDAYHVITPEEEVALLAALRIKVLQTHYAHSGIVYYNMHDYIDEKKNTSRTIFVNVTRPMKYLDLQRRDNAIIYNIPKR